MHSSCQITGLQLPPGWRSQQELSDSTKQSNSSNQVLGLQVLHISLSRTVAVRHVHIKELVSKLERALIKVVRWVQHLSSAIPDIMWAMLCCY